MAGNVSGTTGADTQASGSAQDARAQARTLQKQLDRELDGIPSPTRLHVKMNAGTQQIAVQVVDVRSGDVLRQIPCDEALALARAMRHQAANRD